MKVFEDEGTVIVVLEPGDKIIDSLKKIAKEKNINGYFKGIGAVKWAEIGYGDAKTGKYNIKRVTGGFEVLGLNGNITLVETGEIIIHAHILLGDREHRVLGGHLIEGEVSITCEIFINRIKTKLQRERLGETDFKVIKKQI